MSRGIGQLQRKILAFAYATNKAFHGGEYVPPPGIFKPYPEVCGAHGLLYIATNATGELHPEGGMSQAYGLKRQDPNRPWERKGDDPEFPVLVRSRTERSWVPKDEPRWIAARSAAYRAIANLRERRLIAQRFQEGGTWWIGESILGIWQEDDFAANLGQPKRKRFGPWTPEERFHLRVDTFLTPAGVEIARNEPPMDFDFEELFGFRPEALGQMVEVAR